MAKVSADGASAVSEDSAADIESGPHFFFFFFLYYRGIVHRPSDDERTERTWFVSEHRPRKHFLSDQSKASKMSTLCQLVLTKIPDKCKMCETPALPR